MCITLTKCAGELYLCRQRKRKEVMLCRLCSRYTLVSIDSVKRPDDTSLFHTNVYRRRADRNEYLGGSGAEVNPYIRVTEKNSR